MNFTDILKKSSSILIEGDRRSGKFLLSLYLSSNLKSRKTLVLSFYEKGIFLKRLESAKSLIIEKNNTFLKNLFFLNIKSNYESLKHRYGYKFLFEDIKKAYEEYTPNLIILQRPDLIFDINNFDEVKDFFLKLIEFCNKNGLKIIVTTNKEEERGGFFLDFLENYIDLELSIKKGSGYEVNIESSLFPIEYERFDFIYNKKEFKLEPKSKDRSSVNSLQIDKKILLICEDDELIRLHEYIFKNESSIELVIVRNVAMAIQKVLENPDIIIYYDNSGEVNLQICEVAKNNNLNPDILYIVKKDFVRNSDIMAAIKRGCFDVLPKSFRFEDYIIELQKLLKDYFYSNKIEKIPDFKSVDYKKFFDIVNQYIKEGIFFTLIKTNKKLPDLEKIFRNRDIVYMGKKYTYILVLDIRKIDIPIILEKLNLKIEDVKIFESDEISSIDMIRKA